MRPTTVAGGLAKLLLARATKRSLWSHVTALITMRCNYRCAYCDFHRHEFEEWPKENWLRLLPQLRQLGTIRLSLSGGEPLLRPDLPELTDCAAKQGFITSLVTNGALLQQRLHEIRQVDYLLCTIEGDRQTHDKVRGEGSFEQVVTGIEAVRRNRKWKIGLICPVHKDNLSQLEEPLKLGEQLGAGVFYQPVQIRQGWQGTDFERTLSEVELHEALRTLQQWKQQGRPVGNSHAYLRGLAENRLFDAEQPCTAGETFVTLLPDGRALPCCMLPFSDAISVDPNNPALAMQHLSAVCCQGCSIAPYYENTRLLNLSPSSIVNALKWNRK